MSCYILFFFFLYWGFSLCFRWRRSGTNTKQTLLLSDATVGSERSKDSMDLTLGLGGSQPTWPSTSEIKEAKLDRKENKNIWFYQNQTLWFERRSQEGTKRIFIRTFFLYRRVKKMQQKSLWWCYFFICLVLCLPRLSNCDSESVCRTSVYCCSFKCLLVLFPF